MSIKGIKNITRKTEHKVITEVKKDKEIYLKKDKKQKTEEKEM